MHTRRMIWATAFAMILSACGGSSTTDDAAGTTSTALPTTQTLAATTTTPTVPLSPYQIAKKAAGFPESSYRDAEYMYKYDFENSDRSQVTVWSEIPNVTLNMEEARIVLEIVSQVPDRIGTITVPDTKDTSTDVKIGRLQPRRSFFIVRDVPDSLPAWVYATAGGYPVEETVESRRPTIRPAL